MSTTRFQPGTRLAVFTINETREGNEKKAVWVKAGSAWVNRDRSLNVYLDVLPLDGKLHVREALEKETPPPVPPRDVELLAMLAKLRAEAQHFLDTGIGAAFLKGALDEAAETIRKVEGIQ